jgi:hypothetical protein
MNDLLDLPAMAAFPDLAPERLGHRKGRSQELDLLAPLQSEFFLDAGDPIGCRVRASVSRASAPFQPICVYRHIPVTADCLLKTPCRELPVFLEGCKNVDYNLGEGLMPVRTIPEKISEFLRQRADRMFCDSCIQERMGLKWRQQVQLITATLAVTDSFRREFNACCGCHEAKSVTHAVKCSLPETSGPVAARQAHKPGLDDLARRTVEKLVPRPAQSPAQLVLRAQQADD